MEYILVLLIVALLNGAIAYIDGLMEGITMLSDVVRGLISVKRGDNGIMYFQMLSMTFKQLELQKLKLEAMKQPGKMRKYSFMLLGCFLLMYLGVLGYVVLEAFGELF